MHELIGILLSYLAAFALGFLTALEMLRRVK